MNEAKRDRLKRQAQRRYEDAVAAAAAQLRRELDGIDVVFMLENKLVAQPLRTDMPVAVEANSAADDHDGIMRKRHGNLALLVWEAMTTAPAEFTADEINDLIHKLRPDVNGSVKRKSVFNALSIMAREGIVTVAQKGVGRTPTTFRRVGQPVDRG